jgi:predicted aminopeptidase
LLLLGSTTPGCYLTHLASGQWRLLQARQSIDAVLANDETSESLREQLELVLRTRAFASDLGLEVGGQYTSYVPWRGDRIITSVVAAEPGKLEPATFWFPIVGRVPYRGFFDRELAESEAQGLRADGYDVCIGPIPAYSTLGWFDDPVTEPMLAAGEGRLVETLLHELVHATAFVASQPEFNEGVATFVGEEASVSFFAETVSAERATRRRSAVNERRAISREVLALRDAVAALYEESPSDARRGTRRAELEEQTRARLAALPMQVYDAPAVGENARLNDACLALAATYTADLPAFAEALERGAGLPAFIRSLRIAPRAEVAGELPVAEFSGSRQ